MNRTWWIAAWAAWLLAVLTATHWPNPGALNTPLPEADKLVHTALYGVMGMLSIPAWASKGTARPRLLVIAIALVCLAGLDESTQAFVPGRNACLPDFFANILGLALGLAAVLLPGRRQAHTPPHPAATGD